MVALAEDSELVLQHRVQVITLTDLAGVVLVKQQVLEPSQKLVAARDQIRRSDDRGQARFAQELSERVSVVLAAGDNLMQDRGQLLRLMVERVLQEIKGQLRLPL